MNKKHLLALFSIVTILSLTSFTFAQEQWLQYHSAREAREMIGSGDISYQSLTLSSEKPQNVQLPGFTSQEPLYGQWSTPMAEAGQVCLALDRTHTEGPYDRLFIDSNGNGHLNDESAITSYRTDQSNSYFGPVKVVFKTDEGPTIYHLNIRFYNSGDRKQLYVYSGGWYEGAITVGADKMYCVLLDRNANGTFNDKIKSSSGADRIRIGKKNDRNTQYGGTYIEDTQYVGTYIEIDGQLYEPEIARDGAYVIITKAKNVKFGTIKVPETITELVTIGGNGRFTRKLEKGLARLPAGKYHIDRWIIDRKDDKGRKWQLEGRGGVGGDFEITEESPSALDVGEPVVSTVSVQKDGSRYNFNHELRGNHKDYISLRCNGSRPPAPKLTIRNSDNTYNRTFALEYG